MRVIVNGEEQEVAEASTIADLLSQTGLAGTPCAVEVNKALIPKRKHAEHSLHEGDRVELVTLVGGG